MSEHSLDFIPAGHPPVLAPKIGVLLLNLGTPDATDYFSVRRYLSEFLSDPRVIELPALLWQPILQLIILSRRPFASGHAYASIWNHEKNESPLLTITRDQCHAVAQHFSAAPTPLRFAFAMRYGNPSIASGIEQLRSDGCQRILIFPLYPQYCAATTATAQDKVFAVLKKMRWQPALRSVPPFHDDPAYIQALARNLRAHLASLDWQPDRILCSFHGIPYRYFMAGDPYHCFCQKTSRLLREEMGWDAGAWLTAFQSRFGPTQWLQPYTDKVLQRLAQSPDSRKVLVISPGFVADCIETLEELNIRGREDFMAAGGTHFSYAPCMNDTEAGINMLTQIIRRELQGWVS